MLLLKLAALAAGYLIIGTIIAGPVVNLYLKLAGPEALRKFRINVEQDRTFLSKEVKATAPGYISDEQIKGSMVSVTRFAWPIVLVLLAVLAIVVRLTKLLSKESI